MHPARRQTFNKVAIVMEHNPSPILLIDDNSTWLETLAEYLREQGLPVVTATDPCQGLALLAEQSASVVVCDFNMPSMDGLEVLRQVRGRGNSVAVLMLTSEEEPELERQALAEGAGGFFHKSASPAHLLRQLLRTLAVLRQEQANAPLELWQRLLPSPFGPSHANVLFRLSLPAPRRARSA